VSGSTLPAADRRNDIDGLRGLAVILVVLFHAGFRVFSGAFVAVDVFFVLSGFFLGTSLARTLATDDDVRPGDVYARRVWRLLPSLAVVLLATLASALLLYAPIDRAAVADGVATSALFISNLAFAAGGVNYFHAGENPLLHTWTLGVELQVVLVFPLLVLALAGLGRRRAGETTGAERRVAVMRTVLGGLVIIAVASFAISATISSRAPMWAYFGPHARLWAFCAGAIVALLAGGGQSVLGTSVRRVTVAQAAALAGILVPAFVFDRTMPYPGAIALAPVAGTVLLLIGGTVGSTTPIGSALSFGPLVSVGRVSYAWYLWHLPMMVVGAALVPTIGPWGRLACGAAGLGCAVVTHRLIERRMNGPAAPRLVADRPMFAAAMVCGSIFGVATIASIWSAARVERSVHRVYAAARADRMEHPCWVESIDQPNRGSCAFGDIRSATTIALLGDSHAEHWLGGLDRAGKAHGWRIEVNVMGGCPVADFSRLISGSTSRRYYQCSRYREAILRKLIAQKPGVVLLSSFDYYMESGEGEGIEQQVSESAWTEGLRRTYARLTQAGIRVIAMRGTPLVPFNVPSCLSRRAAGMAFATNCTYALDRAFIQRARRAQDAAARGLPVRFVDMNDLVCSAQRCVTERNGLVMFTDNNHLTASFSKSLAGPLGDRLQAALRN